MGVPRRRSSIGATFSLVVTVGTVLVLVVTGAVTLERLRSRDERRTREVAGATAAHVEAAVRIAFADALDVLGTTNDCLTALKDEGIADSRVYDIVLKRVIEAGRYGAWLVWDAPDAPRGAEPATGLEAPGLDVYWHQNGMEMLREAVPAAVRDSDLYRVPRRTGRAFLLEPHSIEASAGDPTAVTSFARPLLHDGLIVGALAVDLKLDAIADALGAITLPDGATITVVSDGGIVAASVGAAAARATVGAPIAEALPELAPTYRRAKARAGDRVRDAERSSVAPGPDGTTPVLTAWSTIDVAGVGNPWFLILRMPQHAAMLATGEDRLFLCLMGGLALAAALIVVFATMHRLVAAPLKRLSAVIDGLGRGAFDLAVPGRHRSDEIGDVARAIGYLRDGSLEIARLQAERAEAERRLRSTRRAEMDGLSEKFSRSIEATVATLDAVAATVDARSGEVTAHAGGAVRGLALVSQASGATKASMASVAAATASLVDTIGAIGDRTRAGEVASTRVERHVAATAASVHALRQAIDAIGAVVLRIRTVADQIDLIALNASIEAARAGEAGRGFSVVAGEIKGLAMRTARATEEIGAQIAAVEKASGATDASVADMSAAISAMRTISAEIAGALDIQLKATGAISVVVGEALGGADDLSGRIGDLATSSRHVERAADVMRTQSGSLNGEVAGLRSEVANFLACLRAA